MKMTKKNLETLFIVSLAVTGVVTLVLGGAALFDIDLSDGLRRFLGIADLVAVPAFVYAALNKIKGTAQVEA